MAKDDDKKITITINGPYRVSGNVPLNQATIECDQAGESEEWKIGHSYDQAGNDYMLCRCGRSEHKPHCDGSHRSAGFVGTERAGRPDYLEEAELLEGPGLDLLDDESLCVGARFCDRAGSIWRRLADTQDPEARDLVRQEGLRCPSGRLTVVEKDGSMLEPKLQQEISLVEDPINDWRGPLWVKGGIQVEGENGENYEVRNRVTLCRCGESSNMPYCDASHYKCPHMKGLDRDH